MVQLDEKTGLMEEKEIGKNEECRKDERKRIGGKRERERGKILPLTLHEILDKLSGVMKWPWRQALA